MAQAEREPSGLAHITAEREDSSYTGIDAVLEKGVSLTISRRPDATYVARFGTGVPVMLQCTGTTRHGVLELLSAYVEEDVERVFASQPVKLTANYGQEEPGMEDPWLQHGYRTMAKQSPTGTIDVTVQFPRLRDGCVVPVPIVSMEGENFSSASAHLMRIHPHAALPPALAHMMPPQRSAYGIQRMAQSPPREQWDPHCFALVPGPEQDTGAQMVFRYAADGTQLDLFTITGDDSFTAKSTFERMRYGPEAIERLSLAAKILALGRGNSF